MLFYICVTYMIIQFIILNIIYFKIKVYYSPLTYKDKITGKIVDVHKLYEAFQAKDELVYWKLVLFGMILFPIKFFSLLILLLIFMIFQFLYYFFSKKFSFYRLTFEKYEIKLVRFFSWLIYHAGMINLKEKKVNCEDVYKKYLGPDYDFKDDKYSLLISNHLGFYDVIINLYLHPSNFIAKKDISTYPLFGILTKLLNCVFVDRKSETSRSDMLKEIYERQIQFYNQEILIPLLIYPEGTTTCGRNILKFKKGAFASLLPIKPGIININQADSHHLASGCQDMFLNACKFFCSFSVDMYYINMPVIRPTEYMFKNYKHLGNEKWEIFAEVTRKIYSEIGGLKEWNQGYRESHRYGQSLIKGKYEED